MEPSLPATPPTPVKVDSSLPVMQEGEHTVFDLKRHPIGIISTYTFTALFLMAAAVLCFIVPSSFTSTDSNAPKEIGIVAFLVIVIFAILFSLVATIVYWGNRWILTTDSVTQVTQRSLFNRESSQLSLGNVEDVSAEKKGILTYIFNFGALKVETAGETGKFVFNYCPNPNYYAQQLLSAREAFKQGLKHEQATAQAQSNVPYPHDGTNIPA